MIVEGVEIQEEGVDVGEHFWLSKESFPPPHTHMTMVHLLLKINQVCYSSK